jgi:hypothetical protein
MTKWLLACGIVIAHRGSAERAARLLGCAERQRDDLIIGLDHAEARELDEASSILRERLYPEVFESAWKRGRSLTDSDVLAEVRAELESRPG